MSEGHSHGTSPVDLGLEHYKCVSLFPLRQSILPSVFEAMGEQVKETCIWSVGMT